MRRRYRAFREAHGYKPWKYYKGRERWTPLPPEFRNADELRVHGGTNRRARVENRQLRDS